jgi:dihydroneopterin triphosphate diphosphatase
MQAYKIPRSVLVVIYTAQGQVLLIERVNAQGQASGVWQSVTGSLDRQEESFFACAVREIKEETGLDALACAHRLTDWQLGVWAAERNLKRLHDCACQ